MPVKNTQIDTNVPFDLRCIREVRVLPIIFLPTLSIRIMFGKKNLDLYKYPFNSYFFIFTDTVTMPNFCEISRGLVLVFSRARHDVRKTDRRIIFRVDPRNSDARDDVPIDHHRAKVYYLIEGTYYPKRPAVIRAVK